MTLKASDLPSDGTAKLVLIGGTLFEVARTRSSTDRRRRVYRARVVPEMNNLVVPPPPHVGWWYRFTWKLMQADLKLMARGSDPRSGQM